MKSKIQALVGVLILALLFAGCGKGETKKKEFTLLVHMLPIQEQFFRSEVIDAFEGLNDCKINLVLYDKMWDLETILKLQKEKTDPSIFLVKVPFEMTRNLVGRGYMQPLDSIVDPATIEKDMAEYHPLALGLGYVNNEPYYVPRKLETRLCFYLKSKVADAAANWKKFEKELNTQLKPQNGYGLPMGYALEDDPEKWDLYDLFVAGYYWAHVQYFNTNVFMPRIAHRADRYEGTALGLMDLAIQFGATDNDLLRMDSDPVAEMMTWEAAFVKNGIFNPDMWNGAWRGSDLYQAIQDGKVFLTVFQQIDCFNVHGWEDNPEMRGYLKDPSDMGVATMPLAVSFALNPDGSYKATGTKKITTGGWWWGIPKTSPDKALAYKLARFITNHDNQAVECSKFGMVPVRKDIINRLNETFELGWVGEIFKVSVAQLDINGLTTVPLIKEYGDIGKNYIEAWYGVCVNPYGKDSKLKFEPAAVRKALETAFVPLQKEILKDKYPVR